ARLPGAARAPGRPCACAAPELARAVARRRRARVVSDPRGDPPPFPPFELAKSERIYDSYWCALRRDHVQLPDGKLQEYHVFEIHDAVAVVPVLPDGSLVMLWQYRHPLGKTHWEVPAGRVDEGESAAAAAERELLEETGYRARRIVRLGAFHPTNGISPHHAEL